MSRALLWVIAGFVTLAASPGHTAILTFEDVYLTGEQEVPPSSSLATGLARITYDTTLKTLSIDVDVVGIRTSELNPVVAPDHPFHIHLAPPGQNGSIVLLLGSVSDWQPVLVGPNQTDLGMTLSLQNIDVAGNLNPQFSLATFESSPLYLNIHTFMSPSGEIRGNFGPLPEPSTLVLLGAGLAALATLRRRTTR